MNLQHVTGLIAIWDLCPVLLAGGGEVKRFSPVHSFWHWHFHLPRGQNRVVSLLSKTHQDRSNKVNPHRLHVWLVSELEVVGTMSGAVAACNGDFERVARFKPRGDQRREDSVSLVKLHVVTARKTFGDTDRDDLELRLEQAAIGIWPSAHAGQQGSWR